MGVVAVTVIVPLHVWGFALALAASVPLLWWSITSADTRAHAVRSNLGGTTPAGTDVRELELTRSARDRLVAPVLEVFGRLGRRFTPVSHVADLERRVALAGMTARWPVERLLAVKLVLATAGFAVGLLGFATDPSGMGLLAATALPAVAYLAPDVVLRQHASKRQEALLKKLPDALDELTISVEAGLGFEAAMAEAGRSTSGPVGEELLRTIQDIRIGVPRAEAMSRLVRRTEVSDLRHFVVAVRQAEQYGVPIAKVLRVQSREMRERRRQRAEERAMKMPVKILIPTVFFVLPALFIVILGPAVFRLAESLGR